MQKLLKILFVVGSIFSINACIPTKQLSNDEVLLYNQSIKGANKVKIEELEVFYRQKPNRKILNMPFTPYLYFYYAGEKKWKRNYAKDSLRYELLATKYDSLVFNQRIVVDNLTNENYESHIENYTSKILKKEERKLQKLLKKRSYKLDKLQKKLDEGNWLMTSVGEKPTILDTSITNTTAEQLKKYLNSKGYFSATVSVKLDTVRKKLVTQQFIIDEKSRKMVRNSMIECADSALLRLIALPTFSAKYPSLIKKNEGYDEKIFENERERITRVLRDNGYVGFFKNYITFKVDSFVAAPDSLDIITIIARPSPEIDHKVYKVDTVIMDTDVDALRQRNIKHIRKYNNITYIMERFTYSPKVLDTKIFLRPNTLYSQTFAEETQRSLSSLDIFKFVNIKYDTTGGRFKVSIFTSPFKKFQISTEAGMNVTQTLPGPYGSVTFKNRNMLGSCDIFDVMLRYSVVAQAAATELSGSELYSREITATSSLTFPRIMFPLGGKLRKTFLMRLPQTQFNAGLSYIERPEYTRNNIQGGLYYRWRNNKNAYWSFGILDATIIHTPQISESFSERLLELQKQGNTLIRSFDNSLVTNSNISYTSSNTVSATSAEKTKYIRLYFESGGTYLNFVSDSYLAKNPKIAGLSYFRYVRFSADWRKLVNITKKSRLATRLTAGIANSYGDKNALPYEKYFFIGGSNSLRAWNNRRLGPGSYSIIRPDGSIDYRFEQGGEIMLETNAELRFPIIGFIEGALFVDAGNIWMINNDPTRAGAQFNADKFWKEIAIGTGIGLRFNFSFLIMRFDIGVKMYDPALPLGNRYVGDRISFSNPFGDSNQAIYNIGIGYPF